MEQRAFRLARVDGWTYLGGDTGTKAVECVVRAFDAPIRVTTGTGPEDLPAAGAGEIVPPGQGRRLEGHHFFARPLPGARGGALVSVRGIEPA